MSVCDICLWVCMSPIIEKTWPKRSRFIIPTGRTGRPITAPNQYRRRLRRAWSLVGLYEVSQWIYIDSNHNHNHNHITPGNAAKEKIPKTNRKKEKRKTRRTKNETGETDVTEFSRSKRCSHRPVRPPGWKRQTHQSPSKRGPRQSCCYYSYS